MRLENIWSHTLDYWKKRNWQNKRKLTKFEVLVQIIVILVLNMRYYKNNLRNSKLKTTNLKENKMNCSERYR